jgi:hypothetical protein
MNDPSPEQIADDAVGTEPSPSDGYILSLETPQTRRDALIEQIDLLRANDGSAALVQTLFAAMRTVEFEHLLREHLNVVCEHIRGVTSSDYWGEVKAIRSSNDPMIWKLEVSTGKSYINTRGENLYSTKDQALTMWYAEQGNKLPALLEAPPTVDADPIPF